MFYLQELYHIIFFFFLLYVFLDLMWNKYSVFWIVFLYACGSVLAQDIPKKGTPFLENFSPNTYHDAGKIWQVEQSPNHLLYMAAEKGLLEFDGVNWSLFKGSVGYTRSVFVQSDSVIYTGSDSDFGIWTKNKYNRFTYKSIYPFKNNQKEMIEEFWSVYALGESIVFQSFNNVYFYKKGQITKIPAPERFSKSFLINNKLYLIDEKYGLYVFNGIGLKSIYSFSEKKHWDVVAIEIEGEDLLLITKEQGILKLTKEGTTALEMEVTPFLKKEQVFCFEKINEKYWAFGTILNGIYITNKQGNIIQHINKKKGLSHNTILGLSYTQEGNLWVSMDRGIANIHLVDDFSYFIDNEGDVGTAYTALINNNDFYLGTNQGLYKTSWHNMDSKQNTPDFKLIPGSEGQVWQLKKIKESILCGHNKGLLEVKDNTVKLIHKEPGAWEIQQYDESHILVGNYNGISVFKYKNGQWEFLKKIKGIVGGCRQIIVDKNKIWVNIPNYGVLHSTLNSAFELVENQIFEKDIFKGEELFLSKGKESLWVETKKNKYVYNTTKKQFVKDTLFVANSLPVNVMNGVYQGIAIQDKYRFFPLYNGFALENSTLKKVNTLPENPLVTHVYSFNNNRRTEIIEGEQISYKFNNLEIHFVLPQQEKAMFRYKLDDKGKWSEWSSQSQVEFYGLKEGNYTFFVESKNANEVSKNTQFKFSVDAPWYKRWYAYLSYFVIGAIAIFISTKWHGRRLKKQEMLLLKKERNSLKEQAKRYNEMELLKNQRKLEKEKENLQNELKEKSKQLAKKAKESKDNTRILEKVKEDITYIEQLATSSRVHKQLKNVHKLLDSYLEVEDNIFEMQIEEINQTFFKKLKKGFPELTSYDLRLCAYLKMGMKTKEIAEIVEVLPSSINMSRSRLRKKLKLTAEQDLYAFLNAV